MKTKNLLNKKITQWLLLVAMLVGCSANVWAEYKVVVHFAPQSSWAGNHSVRTNYNRRGDGDWWGQNDMGKSNKTYAGRYIYDGEVWEGDGYSGLGALQFQYNNNGWTGTINSINGWTSQSVYKDKLYSNSSSGSWVNYEPDALKIWRSGSAWDVLDFENGSVTTSLTKGNHDFVIRYGGSDRKNNGTMTRSNCTGWVFDGSNDCIITADIEGNYTFKIVDDNGKPKLSVTYPAFPLVKGSWDSWQNHNLTNGTSVTLSLTKSDNPYEFGVQSSSGNFYKKASITRSNCTNVSLSTEGNNATLAVDITGNYTFTWDATNHKVSVTYPTCPTPSLTSVTGDTNVKVGSEHTYTANGASAGTGATISSYDWTLPSGWTKKSSSSNTITVTVGNTTGSASISCKVTNSCGTKSEAKSLSVTVVPACTEPTTVGASAVYNNNEDTWKDTFADDHRSAVLTATPDVTYYQWYGCDASGNNLTTSPTNVQFTNANKKECTATFNLPGTYYFRVKASCNAISGTSPISGVITVNVPYPTFGIEGPGIDNCGWDVSAAASRTFTQDPTNPYKWTKTYTPCSGEPNGKFIIIQRYKQNTTSDGWAGCYETCTCSSVCGNSLNVPASKGHVTNQGGFGWDTGDGYNFYSTSELTSSDQAKITIEMTGYDSYNVKLEKLCDNPVITANPSTDAQTLCEGVDATQLSVTATGTDCTYQWYSYTNAGGTTGEASISGATSASYKPATTAAGTLYYRCKVTACETTVPSNVSGGVTVTAGPGAVTKSPAEVHPYEVTTFTASGSGAASAEWSIQTRPSGVTADEAYLLGSTTGSSVKFKGEAANGYVVRAAANGCNTDTQFNVVADPNNCQ